ncbi:MAG: CBS domain-containing protein [Rhodospirillales bacterium]|nr:CBS domain-containing protein [Rhodospirillales bacterium]
MSPPEAGSSIAGVSPFDRLAETDRLRVSEALTPSHYAAGATVLNRWQSPPHLFIVSEGAIEEQDGSGAVVTYRSGEMFDARGLLHGRSENQFVARADSVCQLLPAQLFTALARSNPSFRAFFQDQISRSLDAQVAIQQQREAASLLTGRVGESALHPPIFVGPETTIREAIARMQVDGVSAVLVRREEGARYVRDGAIGIFTERDVREKHLLMGLPETTPLGEITRFELLTIDSEDLLLNALIIMTKYAVRHLVVLRGREIAGLFEQADLLRRLSSSSLVIASQVEQAETDAELKGASEAIPRMVRSLFERGVKPRHIARMVTDLNRKLFRQVFERVTPAEVRDLACLIVMGSEGRGEQLLRTDQDNGLIFRAPPPAGATATAARRFTEMLLDLGYPPCPGKVMVSNPVWAKAASDYERDLRQWFDHPTGEAFLNLAILIDAETVTGDASLLAALKARIFAQYKARQGLLSHFARAILSFPTPLGLFNRLHLEESPQGRRLDIKKGGIFPIVHGVRSLAVEYQIEETNTIARVQALSDRGPFDRQTIADIIEAFEFMSMLRLRAQLAAWDRGEAADAYILPAQLSRLDRNLLKDSLRIVKQFKQDISYHFKLNMVS